MKSLDEEIEQLITLGHKDPHDYPDLLRRKLGEELLELAAPYIDNFLAEMARQRMNALRRVSVARITSAGVTDPNLKLHSLWVPSESSGSIIYKRIADMTPEDFDARADYLDAMAAGIWASAQWCRDVASRLRDRGLSTAATLDSFPPIPHADVDD